MKKITLISDTHGYLDENFLERAQGSDYIFHSGDIGDLKIIDKLSQIAEVITVSGNIDGFTRSGYPIYQCPLIEGIKFLISHLGLVEDKIYHRTQTMMDKEKPKVVVFGHSHEPFCDYFGDVLFFNPGSAGPKREELPRTFGTIIVQNGELLELALHYLRDQNYPVEESYS